MLPYAVPKFRMPGLLAPHNCRRQRRRQGRRKGRGQGRRQGRRQGEDDRQGRDRRIGCLVWSCWQLGSTPCGWYKTFVGRALGKSSWRSRPPMGPSACEHGNGGTLNWFIKPARGIYLAENIVRFCIEPSLNRILCHLQKIETNIIGNSTFLDSLFRAVASAS